MNPGFDKMDREVYSPYVWYQQGDVTIKPVPKIPRAATPLNHRVLAEGATTGDQHLAEADDVRLFLHEDNLFMRAPTGTTVAHPKRPSIQVPAGDYLIGTVRVFDHFPEEEPELY